MLLHVMERAVRNPFRFGSVVTGEDFADRARELHELSRELTDGQHLFLLSPRRFGKTSLVLALLDRLRRRGVLVAYVDVFRATSAPQLLELLAQAVLSAAETRPERLLRLAVDLLGRLRPQVGTDTAGRPTLTLEVGAGGRSLLALQEEVLALPQRLATARARRLVVAFDEFQEIQRFPGAALEKAMRSHFQRQDRVSYLFSGSKESLLRDMATRERSPFYKFGRTVSLGPIPPEEFRPSWPRVFGAHASARAPRRWRPCWPRRTTSRTTCSGSATSSGRCGPVPSLVEGPVPSRVGARGAPSASPSRTLRRRWPRWWNRTRRTSARPGTASRCTSGRCSRPSRAAAGRGCTPPISWPPTAWAPTPPSRPPSACS
jgi:hypothetical protein